MDDKSTERPMVSIYMLAYNHGKYIRQALDGILMQKVDFTYEIVVGEDCSSDDTRDILLAYKEKYPDKMKLILYETNVGYLNNDLEVRRQCTGKYVAQCEGDDYWVDPYKLKKQVEFLESHPEYIGTAHKVQVVDEDGNQRNDFDLNLFCQDEVYTLKHAEKGKLPGQTATLVYRNILVNDPSALKALGSCHANADTKITFFLALHGNVYCFNEVMSHYRYVKEHGDSWNARNEGKNLSLFYFQSYRELSSLALQLKNIEVDFTSWYLDCGLWAFVAFSKKPSRENFEILKEIYQAYNNKAAANVYIAKSFLKKLLIVPFKRIKLLFT